MATIVDTTPSPSDRPQIHTIILACTCLTPPTSYYLSKDEFGMTVVIRSIAAYLTSKVKNTENQLNAIELACRVVLHCPPEALLIPDRKGTSPLKLAGICHFCKREEENELITEDDIFRMVEYEFKLVTTIQQRLKDELGECYSLKIDGVEM